MAKATMDGYRRVSRRSGREGDAYQSPEIQREAIEQWARINGVEIGKMPPAEEDVSGAVAVADRELERLLERVEAGVSNGIIVYKTDRFARDALETLKAAKRIKDAGGRLVGVTDGVDSDQPAGRTVLALMATMAEQHLDQIKAGWERSTSRAVGRGVHIACRAPIGYLRADQVDPAAGRDGRLVLDPDSAPAVGRAFEMRAAGASLAEIRDMVAEETGRGCAKSTVGTLLRNRAYLGEARGPNKSVREGAHEAIVDERTFSLAQPSERARSSTPRNGTLSRQTLLGGLATCEACGHKLQVYGTTNRRTGERVPHYGCHGRYASGDCPAPASVKAKLLDDHVVALLVEDSEGAAESVAGAERRYLAARAAAGEAEVALDQWVDDPSIAATLGPERFSRGLQARQRAVDDAKRKLWDLDDPGLDGRDVVHVGGRPMVYQPWGCDLDYDRAHLRRYFAEVSVAKADPKRRRWQPVEERVRVRWVGQEAA